MNPNQTGKFKALVAIIACCLLPLFSGAAWADRIKDLASVQGIRNNQLVGYGLVVGLDGTGDQTTQTPFTTQSIINMLAQLGTTLPTTQSLQLKNVAAVMITTNLPPFARIEYKESGVISEAQIMGWLARFFMSVLPF